MDSMRILYLIIGVIYLLCLTFVIKHMGSSKSLTGLLPSVCWSVFMVIPYLLQLQLFNIEGLAIQSFGIFFFGFAALVAIS